MRATRTSARLQHAATPEEQDVKPDLNDLLTKLEDQSTVETSVYADEDSVTVERKVKVKVDHEVSFQR